MEGRGNTGGVGGSLKEEGRAIVRAVQRRSGKIGEK